MIMEPVFTAWIAAAVALAGAVGTFIKARGESRHLAVAAAGDVVEMLRAEMKRLDDELVAQRDRRIEERDRLNRKIVELEQREGELAHRIERLEFWILENTDMDPAGING